MTNILLSILLFFLPQASMFEAAEKYIATLVALNYDAELDADSDTISSVQAIAYMHPFYGGEAVYWARALLHLNIIDAIPPQRKGKNITGATMQNTIKAKGTLFPNPANTEINFVFKHEKTDDVKLVINDMFGSIVLSQVMLNEKQNINVVDFAESIYFIHVYLNGIESEVHRFTVIK